jgi:hypothetical protein
MNYRTPAAHAIDSFSSAPSHFANSLLKTTLLERTAMPGRNQQNSRRFLATFARWAISATLITVIVWWLGGLGKIAAIAGRINFRPRLGGCACYDIGPAVDDLQTDAVSSRSFAT